MKNSKKSSTKSSLNFVKNSTKNSAGKQELNLLLGKDTKYELNQPNQKILQAIPNPHPDVDYSIRFTCPEFTSICPITGQPDFAHLVLDYVPSKKMVESKSLKLYLFSYRNHGAFHEDCTVQIAKDLIATIQPKWLRLCGYWFPRGGIPIDVFFEIGKLPKGVFVKEQESYGFRGR